MQAVLSYSLHGNKYQEYHSLEKVSQYYGCDRHTLSKWIKQNHIDIHLKSKILLGFDDEEDDENYEINSEDDLRKRLIEFEKYQMVSNELRDLETNRQDYFTKIPENIHEYIPEDQLSHLDVDLKDLVKAFLEMQKRADYKKPLNTKIAKRELSIKDKTNYIRNILSKKSKVEFTDLFSEFNKEELVVTLLSILDTEHILSSL